MKKISNDALGRITPEEFVHMERCPVVVVLDNVRSLNNIGSFFRTCDAFAVERIVLCGISGTPPNREIHKTALGAEFTVPWKYRESTLDAIGQLKSDNYTPLAVEQVEGAIQLDQWIPDRHFRIALVFGNEVDGIQQSVVDVCSGAIEIPQMGTKHSLNVSVAAGAVLWEVFRHWRQAQ